jgi:hypothetical protein
MFNQYFCQRCNQNPALPAIQRQVDNGGGNEFCPPVVLQKQCITGYFKLVALPVVWTPKHIYNFEYGFTETHLAFPIVVLGPAAPGGGVFLSEYRFKNEGNDFYINFPRALQCSGEVIFRKYLRKGGRTTI